MARVAPLPYKHALKAFGENLRRARNEKDLSQEELAEIVGVGRTYISLVEKGERNPSLKFVYRVSHALKTKASELISF